MINVLELCQQFGQILNDTSKINNGVSTVENERQLNVTIQGRHFPHIIHSHAHLPIYRIK